MEVTIFLCGDVMTGRGIDQVLSHSCEPILYEPYMTSALDYVALAERENGPIPRPVDHGYVWGEALAILADVQPHARIINLETSITSSGQPAAKRIHYRMHESNIPVLLAAGIDCCVLANNHVCDWGEVGLLQTTDTLAEARIRAAGAGRDLRSARAPAVLSIDDEHRILVFACGARDSGIPGGWAATDTRPGVHLLPDFSDATADRIARRVREIKRPGDVAIASIHWGGNWGFEIPPEHQRFAHALIDRAAIDVIHGHSSHHPKRIEVYRNRVILYGCGDFLDDYEGIAGYEEFRDDLVLMYFPTLDAVSGALTRLEMIPLQIRNFRLHRPAAKDRAWSHNTLDRECRRSGSQVVLSGDRFVLKWDVDDS